MTAARFAAVLLLGAAFRLLLWRLGEYLFPHPHEGPMEAAAAGDPLWQPRCREPWGET